jgi:hypothetical protein
MLKQIDSDIWVAKQPLQYFGLNIGTRMTVIRLANNELVVISPIPVNETIKTQLNEIGIVKNIISPNLFHYLFASDFKNLYSTATFWAGSGLKIKKPNLPIDKNLNDKGGIFGNELEYIFFDGMKTITLSGFDSLNEYIFFHSVSQTLILTDTAFNFDDSFPTVTKLVAKIIGGYNNLSPSLLEKIATTEKDKVKKSVEKVLHWDFKRVIMAHGSIIESNGKEKFKQGYEKFLNCKLNDNND